MNCRCVEFGCACRYEARLLPFRYRPTGSAIFTKNDHCFEIFIFMGGIISLAGRVWRMLVLSGCVWLVVQYACLADETAAGAPAFHESPGIRDNGAGRMSLDQAGRQLEAASRRNRPRLSRSDSRPRRSPRRTNSTERSPFRNRKSSRRTPVSRPTAKPESPSPQAETPPKRPARAAAREPTPSSRRSRSAAAWPSCWGCFWSWPGPCDAPCRAHRRRCPARWSKCWVAPSWQAGNSSTCSAVAASCCWSPSARRA